ncbi:uncharacterized protein LOC128990969 isoform X2 [Macrosteles quadrilineatus]|nr:uncharacterized protein LOC128990969 isoform X2 [Macrosteles quadrilineatus]
MTPYLQFLSQIRPTIVKEFPGVKNQELVKIAAKRWNSIDSTVKNRLTEQYQEANTQYNRMKEDYEKHLTPDQKDAIHRAEQFERDLKKERKTKKKSQELGKPKRPVSAFFKYLESRSNEKEKQKYPHVTDWVKAAAEDWKNTSPEVKAKFENERKKEHESWQQQLNEWEQKMIKEGNIDVVRTSSLVKTLKVKAKK